MLTSQLLLVVSLIAVTLLPVILLIAGGHRPADYALLVAGFPMTLYGAWASACYYFLGSGSPSERRYNWIVTAAVLMMPWLPVIPDTIVANSVNNSAPAPYEVLAGVWLTCWTIITLTMAMNATKIAKTNWGTFGYFLVLCGSPLLLARAGDALKRGFLKAARARAQVR